MKECEELWNRIKDHKRSIASNLEDYDKNHTK